MYIVHCTVYCSLLNILKSLRMFWGKCSFWWWFSLAWQNSIYETISSVVMCERFTSSYVNLVVHFQHLVTLTSDCTMTPTACLAITVFENWSLLVLGELIFINCDRVWHNAMDELWMTLEKGHGVTRFFSCSCSHH